MHKKYKLSGNLTGDILNPRGFPQATLVLCPWQKRALIGFIVLMFLWALCNWRQELLVINFALTLFYLLTMLHRLFLVGLALRYSPEMKFSPEQLSRPPNGKEWPSYMVILPMYKEGEVLPELIDSLSKLDYPKDKLDIRLLIEEDDEETRSVADSLNLKAPFQQVLIPKSEPRTKPKACNIGIEWGEADYLVIYDAEDKPEPDKLKKAVWAFAQSPEEVACVQCKLSYYNPDWNFLTRCFTAEYANWFGLCLPGLDLLQAPIPLGGTSNHFKLHILRQVGAWDEYNVTEDCDLGLRLFVAGWRTRIVDSTTWEQACHVLRNWIAQRSRWVKGYIQTYLVQTRDFFGLHKKLGLWNSVQFHLFIGGNFFSQLINPLYWILTLCWLIFKPDFVSQFFPLPIFIMGSVCLFVGNFIFAYTAGIACMRRGVGRLAYYAALMPFYWFLMSIGAWKGFLQLITKPHHWEKTTHFANPESVFEHLEAQE